MEITPSSLLRNVLSSFWIPIALIFVSQALISVGMIYMTQLTKNIIGTIHDPAQNHEAIVSFYVFAVSVFVILYFSYKLVYSYYKPRLYKFLADTLGGHLVYHNHKYFVQNNSGEILHAVASTCSALPEMLDFCYAAVFVLGTLTSSMVVAWGVHPNIGCILGGWICLWAAINFVFGRRGARFAIQTTTHSLVFYGNVSDVVENIAQVRSICAEEWEVDRINKLSTHFQETMNQAEINFSISQTLQTLSFICTEVAIYSYAVVLCRAGTIHIAQVVQLIGLLEMLVTTLWSSSRQIARVIQDSGVYARSIDFLGTQVEKHSPAQGVLLPGSITITDVAFCHPGTALFHNLSLHIAEGEKVGFVGHSGSGKTTLVNLIMGQERTKYSGEIRVGGVDIRSLSTRALRNCFAFVPQKITLFQRSVRANITYGSVNASEAEVIKAARRACAHEFITALPQGYDTMLNIKGLELSGGQRQRLMLARALLRLRSSDETNVLIIDEGTSALDNTTEREVKLAMTHAMEGKTAIVIAHRLSTLEQMDRILVFDNGRIVEEGKHAELIARKGKYRELWDAQLL